MWDLPRICAPVTSSVPGHATDQFLPVKNNHTRHVSSLFCQFSALHQHTYGKSGATVHRVTANTISNTTNKGYEQQAAEMMQDASKHFIRKNIKYVISLRKQSNRKKSGKKQLRNWSWMRWFETKTSLRFWRPTQISTKPWGRLGYRVFPFSFIYRNAVRLAARADWSTTAIWGNCYRRRNTHHFCRIFDEFSRFA